MGDATLIAPDNVLALGAAIFAMAWLGFWIDTKDIGKKISGVVWVLSAGMALSNFNIIPFKSPVYDFVGGTLVLCWPFRCYCSRPTSNAFSRKVAVSCLCLAWLVWPPSPVPSWVFT